MGMEEDENEDEKSNMQMRLLIGDPRQGSKTKMGALPGQKPQDQPYRVWPRALHSMTQ